ncbi:uncharacterized protein LOC135539077 [Oncorhynchus masou masou]|uniref:uncharacterized protein LOC135539077 n=1 Tax=Oncorhynchus masou masou TaxID=90313 RepID=UPI003183A20C
MDPATNTVEDLMLRICHQEGIENSTAVCLYTVEDLMLRICHQEGIENSTAVCLYTVEDLMLRICHQEGIENSTAVCLYTVDGMPLTDDPFFNTWSLKDRHIEIGSELYAMFTPKENLRPALLVTLQEITDMTGEDNVRCHIMLKGDFEVKVDLASDTLRDLRQKLSDESGIPAHVLHYKCKRGGVGQTLLDCGINEESTVVFSLSSFPDERQDIKEFYFNDVVPSVQQSQKGLSAFFSSLYAINNREQRSGDVLNKVTAYI